ncbi:hypothetical protein A3C26_00625 [Candidatus Daviesbacteria bacterium RIFCSPHIGHO2_02_FULL_39_12]|uniref:Uncharacterized protein n=2 Tax=Candidatus Daviesiibacteriota TaxID=1752718 RepID=A0A1F5J9Q5_9BACT|nr:MAG: hypothetical protein A3C26_00625 [Candidatus Daviesbacteria bacterium RIFCSPHIGHO2_02_FULL_39_12]OGE72510.1 MAG: hypothetical protein A3H40_00205 [Candidatus Daviesbacteria bacterium RIFCSPLOWO2_02_FULL_38_15]
MQRTVLQVPLPKELKISAKKAAQDAGFSSLQEVLRVFMKKFASKKIDLAFEEEVTYLSPKAEKRYLKATEDFKKGKNVYYAKDVKEFFKQLDQS